MYLARTLCNIHTKSNMYLNVCVYHGEYNVDGYESPGASDTSATVDHHRPGVMDEAKE